jgi:hypothetical protein
MIGMPHKHEPGLNLHLDPKTLLANGAAYTCDENLAVEDMHFFVCIEADHKEGVWVPLYSGPGIGRIEIVASTKSGHPKVTAGSSYCHSSQVWRASHKAVQLAARTGKDQSTAKEPNTVLTDHVPKRGESPSDYSLKPTDQSLRD